MGLDYVFSFLGDDGDFSKSREQHWTQLCTLFAILTANGLAFNLEKCVIAISELDFLGAFTPLVSPPSETRFRSFWIFLNLQTAKLYRDFWV
jgi:hypothetical protein